MSCQRNKVAIVFGTRPEAIKLAPVIRELKARTLFDVSVSVTGQHRQMLDQILPVFGIVPDADLNLMTENQTLSGLTSRLVEALDRYYSTEKPDFVIVQGDTTTVFAATLVAFYHHIPVGHVEAGLRTGNMNAPWPEEANRVLTTRLAKLHFAPTRAAECNLLKEGVEPSRIVLTGNTVIDALLHAKNQIEANPPPIDGVSDSPWFAASTRMVLITGHRRENFGEGFRHICSFRLSCAFESECPTPCIRHHRTDSQKHPFDIATALSPIRFAHEACACHFDRFRRNSRGSPKFGKAGSRHA